MFRRTAFTQNSFLIWKRFGCDSHHDFSVNWEAAALLGRRLRYRWCKRPVVGGIEQHTREKNDCRCDDYVPCRHSASPVHRYDATKLIAAPSARSVVRHVRVAASLKCAFL